MRDERGGMRGDGMPDHLFRYGTGHDDRERVT